MDELARYNAELRPELVEAGIGYSRPRLDFDEASARAFLADEGLTEDAGGKDVLCLAGGGGQQSAAFGLLGANVTVLDFCGAQLDRDRLAADHYGYAVRTVCGDMRDLSAFAPAAFDIVWHPHSINFVPDAPAVFAQVARVLRPGGIYKVDCHNPFCHGVEDAWTGAGYLLRDRYADGEVTSADPFWEVWSEAAGKAVRIRGPREFRHTLATVVNGLIANGFVLGACWEGPQGDGDAEGGTWDHFAAVAKPFLSFLTVREPEGPPGDKRCLPKCANRAT